MDKIYIGGVTVAAPIGLAPMAGVSDETYRRICKEMGAGLLYTEMISAKAILYHNRNTGTLLSCSQEESPLALQLFGSEPEVMAEAITMIEDRPYDILDFNMGCPVPKVVKNSEGSYLMTQPDLAGRLFEAMVRASKKPVTVKIRAGFSAECVNAPEIAKIAEAAGISAIAVHARTREQYYSGSADWDVIARVKDAVHIPVLGNGDITDGASAKAMLAQTGCDGILIGRAAQGNPWIFSQIRHFLETGEPQEKPSPEEIFAMILRHARALAEAKGEYIGIREMRAHAAWYTTGFRNAAAMRRAVNSVTTLKELQELLEQKENLTF